MKSGSEGKKEKVLPFRKGWMERPFPLRREKASFFAQSAFPRPHLHGAGRRGKRSMRPYLFWYVYLHGAPPHLRALSLLAKLILREGPWLRHRLWIGRTVDQQANRLPMRSLVIPS